MIPISARIKDALDLLRERKISIWKAAEITGLTYIRQYHEFTANKKMRKIG